MQDEKMSDIRNLITNQDDSFFLVGLLNAFMNKFQAAADTAYGNITWKQFFVLVCIRLFKETPTLKELADVFGSSHQNVKQLLLKLEKAGYVSLITDEKDKRKQRITLTKEGYEYLVNSDETSKVLTKQLFAGVSPEELKVTIKVLMQLDQHLKEMKNSI